jgi:hypothetical protein
MGSAHRAVTMALASLARAAGVARTSATAAAGRRRLPPERSDRGTRERSRQGRCRVKSLAAARAERVPELLWADRLVGAAGHEASPFGLAEFPAGYLARGPDL